MYYKYIIIIVLVTLSQGCQSTKKGGAIPKESNREIKLNVLNIDWSDLSLVSGDRRIKDTGFVVSNWAEPSEDIGLYFGALGALVSDLANEKHLLGSLESELKENFDLAKIFFNALNNNQKLIAEVKSIDLNSDITKKGIILEPWCMIFTNEKGLIFLPQLKATLMSESGKAIWEGNYGPMSKNKPFKLGSSMSDRNIDELKTRLNIVYGEITNQLFANIQGEDNYVSKEENQKFTDELMKNLEINFDDIQIKKTEK